MRHAAALICLLVLNGCCCGKSLDRESFAKVPLTLSEAKKLEKAGTTVTVTRKTRSAGGGGACGHSALCIIFLPIILYEAAFPEKWDEVVVTKDGVITLVGSYETGGALIHAQHLVDGEMRETRNIELKELGKQVYVDSARLVALEDGGVRREVLPLSSQHDFIGDEKALLAKENDPHKRALAIHEARLLLEDEGFAFARQRLSSADETDETKAEVLKIGCGTPDFDPLIAEAQKAPGPWTKVRLVGCLEGEAHDAMLLEMVPLACDPKSTRELVGEIDPLLARQGREVNSPMLPPLRGAQAKCPEGPRRALVALWLKMPLDPKDLDALLASDFSVEASTHLLSTEPTHRAAMVKLVIAGNSTEIVLSRLVTDRVVLEPELLESLARYYLDPRGLFTTGPRANLLELFAFAAAAPDGAARTKAARLVLSKAKSEPMFEVARVVLGDRERLVEAAKGLKAPLSFGDPLTEMDLVPFGLTLAGCSQEELTAVVKGRKRMPGCNTK
jgi:hypothetical protein